MLARLPRSLRANALQRRARRGGEAVGRGLMHADRGRLRACRAAAHALARLPARKLLARGARRAVAGRDHAPRRVAQARVRCVARVAAGRPTRAGAELELGVAVLDAAQFDARAARRAQARSAVAGNIISGVTVAQIRQSISDGSIPPLAKIHYCGCAHIGSCQSFTF